MFNFLKKKKEPKNLDELLSSFKNLEKENEKLKREIEKIKEENRYFIGKMDILRYNPFSEKGGDLSFSIGLLNKDNDGIVITSLYAEGGSRVYAKPLEKGASKYSLSKEEARLIEKITEK